jgi:hypothetical protein
MVASNTTIQIKRSLSNPQPSSLQVAELGYSYNSNTIFIGTPDGSGTIAIGGKSYLDLINLSFDVANAAYTTANGAGTLAVINLIFSTANSGYDTANSAYDVANAAFAKANSDVSDIQNYANTVGTAGNTYAESIGTSGNAYTVVVGASSNAWANAVGTAGNAYAVVVGAASNTWANTVGTSGNAYANLVGTSANNYAGFMANAANASADATYVKLTSASQTITGDLAITGNIFFTGNAVIISANTLEVGDSLVYLAANNYTGTDTLPIGIIANYGNATAQNVHTGFIRNPANKEYYLFNGYDIEPGTNNQINFGSNNMTTAVLNADLVTGNLWLGGANAIVWIGAAFDKANAANSLAYNTGIGANSYADSVGVAANSYADSVGAAGNTYAEFVGAAANSYADSVGAAANSYADGVGTAANTNAANASYLSTGTVDVTRGGTGVGSFTVNGILYGNTTGPLNVTAAGTGGQVLQADGFGVPFFGMLDGGTF